MAGSEQRKATAEMPVAERKAIVGAAELLLIAARRVDNLLTRRQRLVQRAQGMGGLGDGVSGDQGRASLAGARAQDPGQDVP